MTSFKFSLRTLRFTSLACLITLAACSTNNYSNSKITKEEAAKSVMKKYPGGTIQKGEMEEWHGKMFWSFDVAMPKTRNITEVAVDPVSGKVVWSGVETPEGIKAEMAKKSGRKG